MLSNDSINHAALNQQGEYTMRKVKYRTEGQGEKSGYFHKWGTTSQSDERGGACSVSIGLVQDESGRMHVVAPHNITFVDNDGARKVVYEGWVESSDGPSMEKVEMTGIFHGWAGINGSDSRVNGVIEEETGEIVYIRADKLKFV